LVARRAVDELRGVALRTSSVEAILVTTSRFAPTIRADLVRMAPIAPCRLIDGETLVDLLLGLTIGVKADQAGRYRIDDAYFTGLDSGNTRKGTRAVKVPASMPRKVMIRLAIDVAEDHPAA